MADALARGASGEIRVGSSPTVQTNGDVSERQSKPAVTRLLFGATEVRVLPSPPFTVRSQAVIRIHLSPP